MRVLIKRWVVLLSSLFYLHASVATAQSYPEQSVNQSYVPPSPNSQAIQSYGNDPVALFEGTPAITLPVYTLQCGSLALPITLSYNFNGLFPLQDASWVGLGWNLNAGGAITRIVEGGVDYAENSGYNYDQYNLHDTIFNATNLGAFLQSAYNNNLGYSGQAYDLAPDLFDAEFNGHSDKFLWYNGKAFLTSWDKDFSVNWPSHGSTMTITTDEGTIYTFGTIESTTNYYYGGADSTTQTYTSAWYLTRISSADGKDTINLNYSTSSTWQQQKVPYQTSYGVSTGTQADLGTDPTSFYVFPSVQTAVLTSITCRNARISFIADTAVRTDITGTVPRLREIDIIDSLTGAIVKKNTFSYEYFGQTTTNPALYERLALKTFSSTNPSTSSDSLTYVFKYVGETLAFPPKSTGIDYWGYCNVSTVGPPGLLPSHTSPYYLPASTDPNLGNANRTPNFTYSSMGALDTIVYPTGGYTTFQYQKNQFYNSALGGNNDGPGICVQSSTTVSNNPTSPQTITKNYTYLQDNGTSSSGVLGNLPSFPGPAFVEVNSSGTFNYNMYGASTNSGGLGGLSAKFYYSKVTESITSNGETHKTDHYFTSFPELYPDVRETEQISYVNTIGTSVFTPLNKSVTNYTYSFDTAFITANAYVDTEYVNAMHNPKIWYSYQDTYSYWNMSYWVRPISQQTTQYDVNGDSLVTTLTYSFNPTTRNLANITQNTSDGQTIKQKFKYPEDYANGDTLLYMMVAKRVLSPVLEKQTWMYKDPSDSVLIAGTITKYDQTIFKPVSVYTIETTKPIPVLNNEATYNGLYLNLISDSRYVLKEQLQYDANANLQVATKASDIPVSYIWDYRHSNPIAEVKNALPADIAYSSFEADGTGGWTVKGGGLNAGGVTGNNSQSMHNDTISKSGLTSSNTYVVSYWTTNGSAYSIAGTIAGYPIQGKRINGWNYFEHEITGQTGVTVIGTGNIDELRLYPVNAQMTTYTYTPLVGVSTKCDMDNRATYYQYDAFGRLKVVLDQDHNVIKTYQHHTQGETVE